MAINFKGFDSTASGVTGSLVYKGTYNATAGTPDLTTAQKGDFYIVDPEGTLAGVTLNVGDHIVFSENASSPITSSMFDVIDNTDAVSSVNAQTGVVVLDTDDISETATNQYFTSARFDTQFATKSTSDLAEGSNLYYTNGRFDTQLATKTTSDIAEGSNLYYTNARFDTQLATKTTDNLAEGSSNLFYTNARFDTQLATKTTSDIAEGSNLYYTDARADARIGAADLTDLNDVNYTAGAPINGYVLKYIHANNRWEAQAEGGGAVGTLQQVTDQGATTTTDITTAQITLAGDLLADSNLARTIGSEANKFITTHSDLNGAIRFKAKASEALSKGDVIYIDGVSGGVPTVSKAQANSASTMPAFGLAYASASLNAEVQIVTLGNLDGINTGSLSVGDTLYVSSTTAGALTNTAPTGEANLIQNIAKVVKVDAVGNSGIYKVGGAGRTNATPNLNTDKVFLGNASNQATPTALSSINLGSFNNNLTTSDIAEGSNLYYTDARFDTRLATKTTSDVSEGSNLYYTDARFDTRLATKTTSDVSEGTNLYYTDARADARIGAANLTDLNDVNYTAGAPINGYVLKYVHANNRWEAQAESAGGGGGFTYLAITNTDSPVTGAVETHYSADTSSGTITVNLPAIGAGNSGKEVRFKLKTAGNNLSITPNGTNTVEGGGAGVAYVLSVQNQAVTLVSDGSSNWEII